MSLSTPCVLWDKYVNRRGYDQQKAGGRTQMAHRVAYERQIGPIPAGLTIDHLCGNPSCVNVEHLEPVTLAENIRRGQKNYAAVERRKTHCPRGHPYDEANTRYERTSKGFQRRCRTCDRERKRVSA